ncbi:MAG: diguanylate cyclase [Thermoleophilia bacterium]|nr:diguanylate cyclase [Thermoleophilia bacterium]
MDSDSPTLVPARDHARTSRISGIFGLPGRLALLTLLAVATCIAGITYYADHRITETAEERVHVEAVAAARSIAQRFAESDFGAVDKVQTSGLQRVLDQVLIDYPTATSVGLYSGATTPKRIAATKDSPAAFDGLAAKSVKDQQEVVVRSGEAARIAFPVVSTMGGTEGVIALELDTAPTTTAGDSSRVRLLLGAVVAGALLGALLLLLLRRELFRPLDELRRVMGQIRGGAKGVRIGWTRSDELGAVANEFDAMVAELEATEAELAKYVKTDPLTGLLTRDAFTERFSAELTRARREGYPIALLAIDIDDLDEINRTHDTAAGDQVLAAVGTVIAGCTRPTDACGRTAGDSFHVALIGAEAARAAVVIQRIRAEIARQVGIGPERTRVTCGYGVAEYPTHAVDQIAIERMSTAAAAQAQRAGRDQALAFGEAGGYVDAMTLVPAAERDAEQATGQRELATTVHALARALDGIDPSLGGGAHSHRVARYAVAVARELGFGDAELRELRSAAVLHDVGKVAVPPAILRVPEAELDERQRGALRYQAWVGRTMIGSAGLPTVADIVFHLPERWDGTGYPERQEATAIPIASRILHAAELLDQLLTGHAGGAAMSPFEAAGELKQRAGTELDPDVAIRLASLVRDEGLIEPVTTDGPALREAA